MAKVVDIIFQIKDSATASLERMRSSLAESNKQWSRAGREIEKTGRSITAVGGSLTRTLTVPLVGAGAVAVNKFAEVDKTMSLVNATMSNSAQEAKLLNDAMSEAAANSTFGMNDAAQAALNFARGGWDAGQAANALAPAMNLAAGEGGNLDTVSAGLMATMNAFKAPADQAAHYADVFANACNNSALDVDGLSNAMSVAAPIFQSGGLSVEDAALAMGVMANNGTDANVAANSLKTGLARLASPAKDGAVWLEKLGINAFDANGNMKDMTTLQGELAGAFSTLNAQEKEAAASAIFGKNQMAPWLSLIGAAPKDVKKLSAALKEEGTTGEMAGAMMGGFGGSIEKLKSSLDVLMTSLGQAAAGYITPFIEKIQGVVDKFNSLDDAQKQHVVKLAMMAAAAGPAIMAFGKITTGVGSAVGMVGKFGNLMFRLPSIGAKVMGAFSGVSSIGGGFAAAGKAILAVIGPAGAVVAAIAAIVAVSILVWKNWDKIKAFGEAAFKKLEPIINAFKATFDSMKQTVVEGFAKVKDSVVSAFAPIKEKIDAIMQHFAELAATPAFQQFIAMFESTFVARIKTGLSVVNAVFTTVFNAVVNVLSVAAQNIGTVIKAVLGVFDGLIQFITGVFTGNWGKAWEGVKSIFANAFNALVGIAKAPINAVIALINAAISGLNKISVSIPDWVPGVGGSTFGVNLPTVPYLYRGTDNWQGGLAMVHDRGGELIDLPRGARVYPHDESIKKAYADGARNGGNITITKLADTIVVREEADIDRIASALAHKLEIYKADFAPA